MAASAEVMLQRTRASSVLAVWQDYADRFPDPESVASGSEQEFYDLLTPLGLRWRSKLLRDLAVTICEIGDFPRDKKLLIALPGIGDYSASAMLSLHMGIRETLIDANVVRWLCRMTGKDYDGETRRQRWLRDLADGLTPLRIFKDYNYGVLDFTMTVCKNRPICTKCPLRSSCQYYKSATGLTR